MTASPLRKLYYTYLIVRLEPTPVTQQGKARRSVCSITTSCELDAFVLIFILGHVPRGSLTDQGVFESEISQRELRKLMCCIFYTCSHANIAFRLVHIQTSRCTGPWARVKLNVAHCKLNLINTWQFLRCMCLWNTLCDAESGKTAACGFRLCTAVKREETNLILCRARLTAAGSPAGDANSTPCQDASDSKSCQRGGEKHIPA